jgi:hypothetical protein
LGRPERAEDHPDVEGQRVFIAVPVHRCLRE